MKMSEIMSRILSIFKGNPSISRIELAKELGVAEKTIYRNLGELKKSGIIRRVDSAAKGGKWEIIENPAAQ